MLEENARFCHAKFVIADDTIKVEARTYQDSTSENILKETIVEVAYLADEWEYRITGQDVYLIRFPMNISSEIYIDLYSQSSGSKKIFRIVIGISYLLLAVFKGASEWGDFTTFDYVFMSGFLIIGLIYFFSALGIRSINLINPYLFINKEKVILKKDLFDKEVIYFKNIEQVKINYLSAGFTYKDATFKRLELGMLNAENLSLVKNRLEKLN